MVPAPGAEPSAERGAVQDGKPGPGPAVAVKAIAGPIQGTAEGPEDQGELGVLWVRTAGALECIPGLNQDGQTKLLESPL